MRSLVSPLVYLSLSAALSSSAQARTVQMTDFDTGARGVISQSEFTAAQNRATRSGRENGTIVFGARTWSLARDIEVNRERLTLRGAGSGRTVLRADSLPDRRLSEVISINAPRVTIERMTLRGDGRLRFPDGFLGFGPGIPGNIGSTDSAILQVPVEGVENAIRVQTNGRRFTIRDCVIRRVSTGIRFSPRMALDGFQLDRVDFFTLNTMIFAAERRPGPGRGNVTTPNPRNPFNINRARLLIETTGPTVGSTGELLRPGRGIILDFGNASFGQTAVSPPVNLGGSVIRNCEIPRVTAWNIGMNRVSNIRLENNTLGGGGAGAGTSFRHVLHMEDQCRNITIRNNDFTQRTRNSNGERISNLSFVWLGGDNGFPRLDNNSGNTFTGGAALQRLGRNVPSGVNFGDFPDQR